MPSHAHVPGCARLNVMRLNAARLNYYESIPIVVIGWGPDRTGNVRIANAAVEHVLNDAPDTASVRVHGFVPVAGQPFALYSGDRTLDQQLFGGQVLETTALYESVPRNVAYDIRAIDYTWLLSRRKVLETYTALSATAIVLDLIARYASAGLTYRFTTNHVVAGLPIIDAITFTNETIPTCLTAICERIGGYWYLDYAGDLHVFLNEGLDAAPISEGDCRTSSDHTLSEDLSQVVTRIVARGGGGSALVDVAVGATEIPVTDDAWYSAQGGVLEALGQRLTYTGLRGRGGTGAIVGTLTTPTAALQVTVAHGAGLAAGTYQYAQTLTNATGETLPGPVEVVAVGATAPMLVKTTVRPANPYAGSGLTPGGAYSWRIAITYAGGGVSIGPPTDAVAVQGGYAYEIYVGARTTDPATGHDYLPGIMPNGPAAIASTAVYRTVSGGSAWYFERGEGGAVATAAGWWTTANNMTDALIVQQAAYPSGPIATFNKVTVSGLEPASGGFSGTKLYRTAANGSQLKLLATNPALPLVDTVVDASLGANAPTTDTAAVPTSNARVPVGATELTVSSTQPFTADGGAGWAQVGNIPIRYTGLAGGKLTGIPAAGVGSLTATVQYGAQVLIVPRLVGVAGVARALRAGEPLPIRIELDDLAAQAALGARLGGVDADGIVEETFSDSRMTIAELLDYGQALLADRKDPRQTLTFVTRDPTCEVGRRITIVLTTPPINGTFRIQRVRFDEIAITGGLARVAPRRTVEASNKLYTFADLLRRLRGREGGAR